MDLIRAVIVGAQGTPYHDCLFVFDLQLPQEFPFVPPVSFLNNK
jgi:ubiquitin-conjugating enzyme E2 O